MTRFLKNQKKAAFLTIFFMSLTQVIFSQACSGSQVTISIQNAMVTGNNKFSFELWINNTGTTTERISAYGGGVFPNIALSSGYTMVVVEQPSDLGWTMNPMTPNVGQTTNIRWVNNPNAASTSMIPNSSVKIAKFEVNSAILPASLSFATSGTQPQMVAYCDGNPNSNTMTFANNKLVYANNNAPVLIAPLPIKLHSFSAEKAAERRAKLTWSSSSEINSAYYEIQRSENAENFVKAGEVKAAGTSHSLLKYEFYDSNIPSDRSNTLMYYRLKMIDLDGSFEYSDIRGLNFRRDGLTGVHMYPNPASQLLNVEIANLDYKESGTELRVYDREGRMLINKYVIGTGLETVDLSNLTSGMYQIVIIQGEEIFREKIIKVQ